MKMAKRIFTLILALTMIAGMMIMPAMAAGTNSITIKHIKNGHTFTAYQVFTGTHNGESQVLNYIDWGTGVNGTALLAALKADTTVLVDGDGNELVFGTLFTGCTNAEGVADVVKGFADDGDRIETFAKIVENHIVSGGHSGTATNTNAAPDDGSYYTYSITGLNDGYYLVIDSTTSTIKGEDYISHYMMDVVGAMVMTTKGHYSTIEKTVSEQLSGTYSKYIADQLNTTHYFKLEVEIADDLHEYDQYYMEIRDTMSKGLVLLHLEEIYIEESTYEKVWLYKYDAETDTETWYQDAAKGIDGTTTVYTHTKDAETGETSINIKWADLFDAYSAVAGDDKIIVKFSSKLTEDAIIGSANPNEVDIIFSNGPEHDDYGYSVPSFAYVIPFGLKVTKVDKDTQAPLAGAKFYLYHLHGSEKYYAVITEKNGKGEDIDKAMEWTTDITQATLLVSDTNGEILVNGLDERVTYYLHEHEAPADYNKLFTDISFSLHPTIEMKDGVAVVKEIKYTLGEDTENYAESGDLVLGRISLTVENKKGTTLPSTGGVGTTLFYIFGGLMVAGAAVLLITKKRMAA